jgi:N-acyl-D-amino-acid deacylase
MRVFYNFLFFLLVGVFFSCDDKEITADILIKNGIVYNGIDTIPKMVNIAIKEDKIVFIGGNTEVVINAKKIIDAMGFIVSPGFIDPHTHVNSDLVDSRRSHIISNLLQGVTTVVVGNDGRSYFPISKNVTEIKKNGMGANVVILTGHGTIRKEVMGESDSKATKEDLVEMKNLVQQEMDDGAFGLSSGLFYAPGSYANTEEVIALAKVVADNDGIYDTHLRDESSFNIGLIAAVKEAIEIGRQANLPVHISHIKSLGADVWDKSNEVIQLIENGIAEGIDITANQYPYDASSTGLRPAVVPRWAESGGMDSLFIRYEQENLKKQILDETKSNISRRGGAEKLLITRVKDSNYVGKNLLEISEMLNSSPQKAVFKILKTGDAGVISFNMKESDIINFMKQPWVVTGSDGGKNHPRRYGTFPRKYHKYVRQEKVISMARFINNSTSKTAEIIKIPKRGKLREGYYADVIIFDPEKFMDKADYYHTDKFSEGLEYSIINGKITIEKGIFYGELNGKILTKE